MLLPTIAFFMIVIIYYLLQRDVTVDPEPAVAETTSFQLDYPPQNIGCSYESKPMSSINNRVTEPIYCGKAV